VTQGVRDKDRKSVSPWIYEGGFIIGDTYGPETGEPIVHIFFAVCVNKLGFNTRD
jgi:hypothetical protein